MSQNRGGMDKFYWAKFGRKFKALRERRGWTQNEVATMCRERGVDWTRPTLAAIETGRRQVSLPEYCVLIDIFGGVGFGLGTLARAEQERAAAYRNLDHYLTTSKRVTPEAATRLSRVAALLRRD